jgi:AcrR family transcriptional regulator
MKSKHKTRVTRQVVGKRRERSHVQQRGNKRRNKLLVSAEELLDSTPVEQLSFRQIADHAGVPEGSAYHFFANKYDLLTALAADMAERFGDVYKAPIPDGAIHSWHELADLFVERAAEMYSNSPAATQIWLGGRMPPQVKLADRIGDRAVSDVIHEIFDSYFVLPELPRRRDVFFFYMELADVILSLSVIEHGEITPSMLEEAKRAGRGYLATYLPSVMVPRGDKIEVQ